MMLLFLVLVFLYVVGSFVKCSRATVSCLLRKSSEQNKKIYI